MADVWGVWTSHFESPVKDLHEVCKRPTVVQSDLWEHGCGLYSKVS